MDTTPAKAVFGMQVVNTKDGTPAGFGKMFLRDVVIPGTMQFYLMAFGLLLMSAFQPSTAKTKIGQQW